MRDVLSCPTHHPLPPRCSPARVTRLLTPPPPGYTPGHNWDVRCCAWHPRKGLIASGSKDCMVKLWDPRGGECVSSLHGHKHAVLVAEWNKNGNWLLTTSKDKVRACGGVGSVHLACWGWWAWSSFTHVFVHVCVPDDQAF